MDKSNMEKDELGTFIEQYKSEARNPLIKGFLGIEENNNLYKEAVSNPTEENRKLVEDAFERYYEDIRRTTYFSNMIRFMSIDFDKKVRKHLHRFPLTLDKPLQAEMNESTVKKDLIPGRDLLPFYEGEETLKSQITDEKLHNALEILTDKQVEILEMKYAKDLSNLEIATITQSTPQNISNTIRKSLLKLKKYMGSDKI